MDFSSVSNEKKEEMVFPCYLQAQRHTANGCGEERLRTQSRLSVVLALPSQDILPRKHGGGRTRLGSQLQKFHARSASLTWACGEAEH